MTKKDYIKLAKAIKDNSDSYAIAKWNYLNELCDILKADNPLFDRERFLAACK